MTDNNETKNRTETWLLDKGRMRRPTSREVLSISDFLEQQKPGIDYVIYKHVQGTYTDGADTMAPWQKVKVETLAPATTKRRAKV